MQTLLTSHQYVICVIDEIIELYVRNKSDSLCYHKDSMKNVKYNMMQTFCSLYKQLTFLLCTRSKTALHVHVSVKNNLDTLEILSKITFFYFLVVLVVFRSPE